MSLLPIFGKFLTVCERVKEKGCSCLRSCFVLHLGQVFEVSLVIVSATLNLDLHFGGAICCCYYKRLYLWCREDIYRSCFVVECLYCVCRIWLVLGLGYE